MGRMTVDTATPPRVCHVCGEAMGRGAIYAQPHWYHRECFSRLCDALDEARARCADYRAACQAIQEGKAAGDKHWRQRWNNLRRHTREQDVALARISGERDAERERAGQLADALDAIEGIAHPPGCTEQGIHDIWTIARAALATAKGETP